MSRLRINQPESSGVGPEARFSKLERELDDIAKSLKDLSRSTDLGDFPVAGLKPTFDRVKSLQSVTLPSLTKELKILRNSIATRMVENRRKVSSQDDKLVKEKVYQLNDKFYILQDGNLIEVNNSEIEEERNEI